MAACTCPPALQGVIERFLQEADRLYGQSTAGVALLPRDCRSAILAARHIYAEIGQQLRRDGLDPVNQRAVVPTSRKLVLLACAGVQSGWVGRPNVPAPPLAAIAYLVEHCGGHQHAAGSASTRSEIGRVGWMLDLMERLEAQRIEQRARTRIAH